MISYLSLSAISFVSGVYIADYFPQNKITDVAVILLLTGIITSLFKKKYRSYIILTTIFLLTGIIGCTIHQNPYYNTFYDINNKYVTIEGYISDLPEENEGLYSYKLTTTHAEYLEKDYPTGQIIKLTSHIPLKYGDSVKVKGFLKEFNDKNNSSDFNVKRYYQSRNIFYKLYAQELEQIETIEKKFSLTYYIGLFKSKYSDALDKEFSGDENAVLKAVTLGNKRQFSNNFNDILIKTGIKKFFYPAFLHIYLISCFISVLFRYCKKSTRDYIFVAFMILYAAINSQNPVLVKNSLTVILGIVILKKYGFSHRPDIISLTVLIITLSNPLYCFDVGFIISLSTGFMLYYYRDILNDFLSFIPSFSLRKFLIFYIITTFGLLPIIAYFFNGVTIYTNLLSPLYAIIVIILIILTPIMCIASSIFGISIIVKFIISRLIWFFTVLPEIIDKLPFSHIWLKPPGFIFIMAFYITLYIIYQIYMQDIKKKHNLCVLCACAGLWFSLIINSILNIGNINIIFVNVGQGDGAIIKVYNGETYLIDGGGKYEFSNYDAGANIFTPYLADNGYFNIDKAFVSHFHSDHCLGIIAALKQFNVKEVVMPDYNPENEYRIEIEKLAKENNTKITYISKGDKIETNSGISINILSPSSKNFTLDDENEASIVMELEYNGFKCLFTGDIGIETEKQLLNNVTDCDVVKMAHHGSANSNSKEFAKAINAEYAVVSLGENNIYDFPRAEAIYNYQQSGTKIARTDKNGDITIKVNKKGNYRIYQKNND